MRRRAKVLVAPVLGLALTGYFAYHLVEGDRGMRAWMRLTQELRFSPDGKLLAVVGGMGPNLHLFDWRAGKRLAHIQSPTRQVSCLAFATDNKSFATMFYEHGGPTSEVLLQPRDSQTQST